MNRRRFFKSLASLALAPAAFVGEKKKEPEIVISSVWENVDEEIEIQSQTITSSSGEVWVVDMHGDFSH